MSFPCVPLIDPVCLIGPVIGGGGSAITGDLFSGVLAALASGIRGGIGWIVAGTADWWVRVPSPDLASQPAVTQLQQWLLPVTAAVAVMAMIVAAGKMVITRKGSPLADVASGLGILGVTTALGVALPTLLLQAGDAWSNWVLSEASGGQFSARMTALLEMPGCPAAIVVVLGVIAILVSAAQAILMLFRQASLFVLAGVAPLAAAGTMSPGTRPWFRHVTGWGLALIFYKPAAAAVYATAFALIGKGTGPRAILMGFAMLFLSVIALPVLMKLFTWAAGTVATAGSGGGFLQTAMGGAIAVGALRAYSGAGAATAAGQARAVSDQLGPSGPPGPSGSAGPASPSGSAGPGSASGAAGPGGPAGSPAPAGAPASAPVTPSGSAASAGTAAGAAPAGAVPAGAAAGAAPAGAAPAGAAAASGAAAGPAGLIVTGLAAGASAAGSAARTAATPPEDRE